MKNFKILNIILSLLLVSSMLGCDFDTIETKNSDTNTNNHSELFNGDNIMDYKIQEIDGEYYIVFDDISRYIEEPLPPGMFVEPITHLSFENVEEMQNTILTGKFAHADKTIIANYFSKDDNGVIIPNPYNVYLPVFPNEMNVKHYDRVTLLGCGYYFYVKFLNDDNAYGDFAILTKNHYNTNLECAKNNIRDKYKVWEKEFDEIIGEKEVANLDNRKIIQYTLSNENKTIYVIEQQEFNDSILEDYDVEIFGESNGVYFNAYINDLNKTLDPEWLFEFDVERYVPEESA